MFSLEILGQSSVCACFLCCPCNTCPCGCAQSRNAFVFSLSYGLYHNWLLVSANIYCAFKCSTNCTCFCVFHKLWNRGFYSVYAPSAFCKPTPVMSVIVVVVFVVVLNFIVACITLHKWFFGNRKKSQYYSFCFVIKITSRLPHQIVWSATLFRSSSWLNCLLRVSTQYSTVQYDQYSTIWCHLYGTTRQSIQYKTDSAIQPPLKLDMNLCVLYHYELWQKHTENTS